jgi:PAS domain S-box-containing protein
VSESRLARRLEGVGFVLARWSVAVAWTVLAVGVLGWYFFDRQDAPFYSKHPVLFESDVAFLLCAISVACLIWVLGRVSRLSLRATDTALRQRIKEEEGRVSFSSSSQAMWICDLDNLRIVDANPAATDLYGYSRQEFIQLRVADLHPPEELPVVALGVAQAHDGLNVWGPRSHLRKNGAAILVDKCGYVFHAGGRRFGLVSVVPLPLSSAELGANDDQGMSPATESAAFGVVRSSLSEDRLLGLNQVMLETLGYSNLEEAESLKHGRQLYHDLSDRDRFLRLLIAQHRIVDFPLQMQTRQGEPVNVRVSAELQRDGQGSLSTIEAYVRLVDGMLKEEAHPAYSIETLEH